MSILKQVEEAGINTGLLYKLEAIRETITKPVWAGPNAGGITQSLMTRFLECPFRFYLYAILGLEENEPHHPNLIWGDIFHKGLEHLIPKGGTYEAAKAAMIEYGNTEYPRMPSTFIHTTFEMLKLYNKAFLTSFGVLDDMVTEQKFSTPDVVGGYKVVYRGKADGHNKSCRYGVEHKCKGKIDPLQSRAESPIDQQILLYSHCLDIRHWTYDIIRIPEAQFMVPQRRPGEPAASYAHRLFNSQTGQEYPISKHSYAWLNQFHFDVEKNQIDAFLEMTWRPLVLRLCRWWDHVTSPGFSLVDKQCYNDIFYITPIRHFDPSNTERYKCKYWHLLTGESELESLVPVTSFYSELEEE